MGRARGHVLVQINDEALLAGALDVERALKERIAEAGLGEEIHVIETGDLGVTGSGVALAVHPDGVTYAHVTVADVQELVSEHLLKGRPVERLRFSVRPAATSAFCKPQRRIVLENCGVIDPENLDEAIGGGAYAAVAKIVETRMAPGDVIEEVKRSGLRGRGGAGFPTGLKWAFTAPGEQKYVVCNADEGEPGTFKDRLILEGDPHRLLEGMMIAGYAIGASRSYIYVRGEYGLSIRRLERAIADARKARILGGRVFESPFSFDIEIKKGAGAYVCGDETALLESLEGKRGYPRIKPPYPGAIGLWKKPTVVNNVETLANVPPILLRGADWFRGFGTAKSPGTKVYTILGHVESPGLIEVEMGTSLRTILEDYGGGVRAGRRFKAALLGGAAGAIVGARDLDVRMDFEGPKEVSAVLGSGAILVVDEETSIVDLLRGILHFFRHESCGQCAPCRLGTARLVEIVDRIAAGEGAAEDIGLLREVATMMRDTSLCPLGQSPILPIATALDRFSDDFTERIGRGAHSGKR